MHATAEITTAMGGKHLSAKDIFSEAQNVGIIKGFIKNALISLAQKASKAEPDNLVSEIIA